MEKPSRREFLAAVGAALAAARIRGAEARERRPNVVLVMTDDQGYGDMSCHGNDEIRTPNIDRLAAEGVEVDPFLVSPVCAPTRACLMTGRYNYRTGVVDTYIGRAMMDPREATIAEMLAAAGYRTGIFGKWHLGDNHPMRPHERGFQEALVHGGGGIGQPSDPPGNRYFDPILRHNGKEERHLGYCTDI
ncbi:MAG: sulfatase-like hydrolase/transferase, partial [Planctomycetes bacterium]|nr:sulfatase-like hydrolase/transferase [Planctomycetota bacterium]